MSPYSTNTLIRGSWEIRWELRRELYMEGIWRTSAYLCISANVIDDFIMIQLPVFRIYALRSLESVGEESFAIKYVSFDSESYNNVCESCVFISDTIQ